MLQSKTKLPLCQKYIFDRHEKLRKDEAPRKIYLVETIFSSCDNFGNIFLLPCGLLCVSTEDIDLKVQWQHKTR